VSHQLLEAVEVVVGVGPNLDGSVVLAVVETKVVVVVVVFVVVAEVEVAHDVITSDDTTREASNVQIAPFFI
jgi:hypothetical protein